MKRTIFIIPSNNKKTEHTLSLLGLIFMFIIKYDKICYKIKQGEKYEQPN